MKIIFVGTGSGKTSRKRFHSSIFVKSNDHSMLIDTGDGVAKALLSLNIKTNSIDSILLSHYHADHFSGIASLITQMKLEKRTKQLKVFTHTNLVKPLKTFLNTSYLFEENLGFKLVLSQFKFGTKQKVSGSISFVPKRNSHIFRKKILKNYPAKQFVSSSFLLNVGSSSIFYTSDVGSTEDLFLFKNHRTDYLISETTHLTTGEILSAAKTLNVNKLFLTHISDEDEKKITMWHKNLSVADKKKIKICYDGQKIQLT